MSAIDQSDTVRGRSAFLGFAVDLIAFAGRDAIRLGVLLFLGALAEGFGILLLIPLFTVVLGGSVGGGWLGRFTAWIVGFAPGSTPFAQILFMLSMFALLLGARSWLILKRDIAMAGVQTGFVEWHRLEIVRLLANTRWDVVARLSHGRITHVLGGDVQSCGLAAFLFLQCTISVTVLAGQLVLAFVLAPLLAILMTVVLAGGALALRPVLRRSRDLGHGVNESNLGLVVTTTEFLGGLKLALSQNLQRSFLAEFEDTLRRAGRSRVDFARQRTGAQLALAAIGALLAGLVMLLGVGLLAAAPATIVAFLFIMARMNGPAAVIQTGIQQIFHSLPAYTQMKALEAELAGAQQGEASAPHNPETLACADVELKGVGFHHPSSDGSEAGVSGIDLRIREGEFVGITGHSGAGKTTLADLVIGLYPPQQGQIEVGGRPLEGRVLDAWRGAISYVSQDPFLFHDSVRRNLQWAQPRASEEDIWSALAVAGADGLVRRLDGGLDAMLGERGTLLSGGERQRIALARALIRKPRLLMLDEATSAIDVAGERLVLQRLAQAADRPSLIIIAHRDESLALCDRIIELRAGRLAPPSIP